MWWEYKIIETGDGGNPDDEYEMNELGRDGWELVTVKIEHTGAERWYFKRLNYTT